MEIKIGEIFENNGEWYQCVEGAGCYQCAFNQDEVTCLADNPHCTSRSRSDGTSVIFKRLEKVGEPITVKGRTFQKLNAISCLGCVFRLNSGVCDKDHYMDDPCINNEIWVEIKQNKEDMEAKNNTEQTPLEKLVIDFFNNRITDEELERKVSELYAEHSNSKNIEKNLKPFDLEAAKAGKPVCTRDGRKARIICFDKVGKLPIMALVTGYNGQEDVFYYLNCGKDNEDMEKDYDLMMLPEKKEGWAVIRRSDIYETEEAAKRKLLDSHTAVMVKKITWEE